MERKVWDLPTRLSHWVLAGAVATCWWSGEEGEFEIHAWVGYSLLCLVLFRLGWGFVGSPHARFRDFVRGPGRKKTMFGTSFPTVGHRHAIGQLDALDMSDEVVADLMGNNARRVFTRIDALG